MAGASEWFRTSLAAAVTATVLIIRSIAALSAAEQVPRAAIVRMINQGARRT